MDEWHLSHKQLVVVTALLVAGLAGFTALGFLLGARGTPDTGALFGRDRVTAQEERHRMLEALGSASSTMSQSDKQLLLNVLATPAP